MEVIKKQGKTWTHKELDNIGKALIEYFSVPLTYKEKRDGKIREIPNDIPMFEGFAVDVLDMSAEGYHSLVSRHKILQIAHKKAKSLQERFFAINAARGRYNTPVAIFLMKNILGYKDNQGVDNKQKGEFKIEITGLPKPKKTKCKRKMGAKNLLKKFS